MPGIVSEDTHLCTKPQPCQGTSTVTRPCPAAAAGAGADVCARKTGGGEPSAKRRDVSVDESSQAPSQMTVPESSASINLTARNTLPAGLLHHESNVSANIFAPMTKTLRQSSYMEGRNRYGL